MQYILQNAVYSIQHARQGWLFSTYLATPLDCFLCITGRIGLGLKSRQGTVEARATERECKEARCQCAVQHATVTYGTCTTHSEASVSHSIWTFCLCTGTGAQDLSVFQNTESCYHDKCQLPRSSCK